MKNKQIDCKVWDIFYFVCRIYCIFRKGYRKMEITGTHRRYYLLHLVEHITSYAMVFTEIDFLSVWGKFSST